ncbi:MAG: hypothetical protein ACJAZX_001527 [Rickettsiales bacterium]|jgi:hypothetical protein
MKIPDLVLLSDFKASEYLENIYKIFVDEVANGELSFLELPIKCPYHPPCDNKHFSFWHLISEKNESGKEEDRIPDPRRCERIKWISYVIKNANDRQKIWCWEKLINTKRGKNRHIHLYLQEERYLVVLRRKNNRLELVTTFVVENHLKREKENKSYSDPR